MKNIAKILLLTLLLALSVFAIASCSDDEVEIEISLKEDSMPQLQYVEGQELDFSSGKLSVKENGTESEIALNAEGVTISGYDKNKTGEQTVTIEYKGKSVQLTVTVVERMIALEQVSDYLVGDALNTSKGRLKITRNDGSTYTVPFSNASVTITGFNSSAPAQALPLTATYTAGQDTYTATFTVNVYAIDTVELHAPNKVAYNSHEGGLDVSGGYLTLKGNGGALSKDVTITADMVSGFDLSKVNSTNTPLNQTLTVTYGGGTYNYDVKLVYTDISLFNENAAGFSSLVWTGSTLPTITDAQGKTALDMMSLYLDMSKAERSYISASDALNVARAAAAYGYVTWTEEMLKFADLFEMSDSGKLEFTCESYASVKAALANVKNPESPLYTVAPLLIKITDEFSKEALITDLTFADLVVADTSAINNKIAEIEYMTALYDKFAPITDWSDANIATYENDIKAIYTFITDSLYNDSSASQLYAIVSTWKSDAFDILYSYYFAKSDMDSITTLANLRLPSELQELFNAVMGAFNQIVQISSYNVFDTSGFFYYYYKAVALSEVLKNTENTIIKNLYDTLPLNGLLGMTDNTTQYNFETLLEYFRTAGSGSFQYYSSSLLGVEAYTQLLDKYVDTLTKLLEVQDFDKTAEYGAAIEELFDMYVTLSPTQQLNFLSTLNAYYNMGYPPLAFDDTGDYAYITCMFTQLLNQYFREKLPTEAASAAYDNLVLAMEIYAQRASYENWLKEFKSRMDSVISTYNAMSTADKGVFDTYLSTAYTKYVAIRERYNEPITSTDLGDWQTAFDALEEAIVNIDNAYYLLEEGYPVYNLLFSAYERADAIVKNLLLYAPEEIKMAYYYDTLYVIPASASGAEEDYYYTYEYMMNLYRGIYIDCMCGYFGGSTNYYDAYTQLNLGEFLNNTYELVWTFTWEYAFATGNATPPVFDKDNAIMVLQEFRKLDRDSQVLFAMMEGDYGLYYSAVVQFMAEAFTSSAASVGYKMVELEQLLLFTNPEDSSAKETLTAAVAELEALYNALEGEDKTSFADLEEVYADIVSDANAMIEAMTPAA